MKFAGIYIGEPSKRSAEEVCCRSNVCSKLETAKSNDPVPQLTLGATSTQALHPAICGRRAIANVSLEEQTRSALQLAAVLFRDTYEKEKLLRVKPPAQACTFDPGQPGT